MVFTIVATIGSLILFAKPWNISSYMVNKIFDAVYLSTVTAFTASVITTLVGVPIGYIFARTSFIGKSFIEALTLIAFAMPPVAVGVSILALLRGPGYFIEEVIGILFTKKGIVVAQVAVSLPIVIRVAKSGFELVDIRLEHVARTLGLSPSAVFLRVSIPLAKKSIYAAFLLAFMRSLGEFGATVVVAGAIEGKTEVIPIALYLAIERGEINLAAALAIVSAIIAIMIVMFLEILEKREYRWMY